VAFDPFRRAGSNLIGDPDVIQVPIVIQIPTRDFLTMRMFERLIGAMNDAAIRPDFELLEEVFQLIPFGNATSPPFEELRSDPNRFLITSISRGSIVIDGAILLGIGWAIRNLLGPGWEMSQTKKHWDEAVTHVIDKSAERLGQNIAGAAGRLRRLRITKMSISHDDGAQKKLHVTMEDHPRLEYREHKKE
jgi:hypothetical protein